MKTVTRLSLVATVALALGSCGGMQSQRDGMSFFVTSAGSGKGADLGGLDGADRHCQSLAKFAGAGGRNWRAYLSASPSGGHPGVNARDRIGRGPWQNAKGVVVAKSVDDLHGANNLTKQSSLSNWTTSGAGAAMVGHHDRQGLRDDDASKSWNSSHLSRPTKEGAPGCSQAALQGTGGNGLFYCFAAN